MDTTGHLPGQCKAAWATWHDGIPGRALTCEACHRWRWAREFEVGFDAHMVRRRTSGAVPSFLNLRGAGACPTHALHAC
eukprot:4677141-Prymnesium_polylepis.1